MEIIFGIIAALVSVAGLAYGIKSGEAAKKAQKAALASAPPPSAFSSAEANFASISDLNSAVQAADVDNSDVLTKTINTQEQAKTWVWYGVGFVVAIVGWKLFRKYVWKGI